MEQLRTENNRTQLVPKDLLNPEENLENEFLYKTHNDLSRGKMSFTSKACKKNAILAKSGLQQTVEHKGSKSLRIRGTYNRKDENAANMALLLDNPSFSNINDISRYIKKLDNRLSVPKFVKTETTGSMLTRATSSRNDLIPRRCTNTQQQSMSPERKMMGKSETGFMVSSKMLS